jgi:hypothetical protein
MSESIRFKCAHFPIKSVFRFLGFEEKISFPTSFQTLKKRWVFSPKTAHNKVPRNVTKTVDHAEDKELERVLTDVRRG